MAKPKSPSPLPQLPAPQPESVRFPKGSWRPPNSGRTSK